MPKTTDENTTAKHLQFASWELDPFCKLTLRMKAERLNVTPATLLRWRRDPLYVMRMNSLRDASFNQHAGAVDKAVIRKATEGSFLHAKLFYEKKGELIQLHKEVKDDISSMTPAERQREINQLIAETQPLEPSGGTLPDD